MGTNNPSEEQLALVEQRLIALADTVVDPGLPMESDSFFDEHGFDLESASGQLSAKIKAYCRDPEGVEPSLEDHPQVRRMARYLLENVDYEILEAPLSPELMQMKPKAQSKAVAVAGNRNVIYGALVAVVLLICVALYVGLGGGSASAPHEHGAAHFHAPERGGGRGRAGRAWRNGSDSPR